MAGQLDTRPCPACGRQSLTPHCYSAKGETSACDWRRCLTPTTSASGVRIDLRGDDS